MVKGALNRLEPHASSVKLLLGAIVVGEYGASDLRLAGEPSALGHGAPLIEQEGHADDGYTLRLIMSNNMTLPAAAAEGRLRTGHLIIPL